MKCEDQSTFVEMLPCLKWLYSLIMSAVAISTKLFQLTWYFPYLKVIPFVSETINAISYVIYLAFRVFQHLQKFAQYNLF